jgi:hypothetical protein
MATLVNEVNVAGGVLADVLIMGRGLFASLCSHDRRFSLLLVALSDVTDWSFAEVREVVDERMEDKPVALAISYSSSPISRNTDFLP